MISQKRELLAIEGRGWGLDRVLPYVGGWTWGASWVGREELGEWGGFRRVWGLIWGVGVGIAVGIAVG